MFHRSGMFDQPNVFRPLALGRLPFVASPSNARHGYIQLGEIDASSGRGDSYRGGAPDITRCYAAFSDRPFPGASRVSNGCSLLEHSSTLISDRVCVPLPSEGGPLETY